MLEFINTKWYSQIVIFILMPMHGYILSFNPILGIILILMQVPYLLTRIK